MIVFALAVPCSFSDRMMFSIDCLVRQKLLANEMFTFRFVNASTSSSFSIPDIKKLTFETFEKSSEPKLRVLILWHSRNASTTDAPVKLNNDVSQCEMSNFSSWTQYEHKPAIVVTFHLLVSHPAVLIDFML